MDHSVANVDTLLFVSNSLSRTVALAVHFIFLHCCHNGKVENPLRCKISVSVQLYFMPIQIQLLRLDEAAISYYID